MLRISYEDILQKIQQEKGTDREEIEQKVKEKLAKLGDLISKEGAAHIVANEYGVKVFESLARSRLKITHLSPGLRPFEVVGKVLRKYEMRSFTKDGREGKVISFLMADETGMVRVTCWDEKLIAKIEAMPEGTIALVRQSTVRENNGYNELHLGSQSDLTLNPLGITVEAHLSQPRPSAQKRIIKDLKADEVAEVWGTIVQAFEPKFYAACPECHRKVQGEGAESRCPQHGVVAVKAVPIVNVVLDDGTENIRVTFFREVAAKALGVTEEELAATKDRPEEAERLKQQAIGQQVKVVGKARTNEMFGRMEFSAFQVDLLDPRRIVEELVESPEGDA